MNSGGLSEHYPVSDEVSFNISANEAVLNAHDAYKSFCEGTIDCYGLVMQFNVLISVLAEQHAKSLNQNSQYVWKLNEQVVIKPDSLEKIEDAMRYLSIPETNLRSINIPEVYKCALISQDDLHVKLLCFDITLTVEDFKFTVIAVNHGGTF